MLRRSHSNFITLIAFSIWCASNAVFVFSSTSPSQSADGEGDETINGQFTAAENGTTTTTATAGGGGIRRSKLLILTLAVGDESRDEEGFHRYQLSAKANQLPVKVLSVHQQHDESVVVTLNTFYSAAAAAQQQQSSVLRRTVLRKELQKYMKDDDKGVGVGDEDTIVLFTETYDVIFNSDKNKILDTFFTQFRDARVVFSADKICHPDSNLASKYPAKGEERVKSQQQQPFLNSGIFIGYVREIHEMLMTDDDDDTHHHSNKELEDETSNQLFYTKIYLDERKRNELRIQIDHRSQLFQTLNEASVSDFQLELEKETNIRNTVHGTLPLILHANKVANVLLYTLGNYIPKQWNEERGCLACRHHTILLDNIQLEDYPVVVIGVFIEFPTPFMKEFWDKVVALAYPKNRIHLFIHNSAEYHASQIDQFIKEEGNDEYASVKLVHHKKNAVKESEARNMAIEFCLKRKCDYYLNLDSIAHIDNVNTLKLLIEQNRPVVSPMLTYPFSTWSNFWGSMTTGDRQYDRSSDYDAIVYNYRRGLWNVPCVKSAYLIRADVIHDVNTRPHYNDDDDDVKRRLQGVADVGMSFCSALRRWSVDLYVSNRFHWGHLINADKFDTSHLNNEMYEIENNRYDWERRYLHVNYTQNLNSTFNVSMPCNDVFSFPMVTELFCDHLIGEMEHSGQWSNGGSSCLVEDPSSPGRMVPGYESVPTRDIQMRQIGFEEGWLYFLKKYVQPLQHRVFQGYVRDPPRAQMNFVVRYHPDEQPNLKPHHDESAYTINVALNRFGIDFQGGGCRFIRQNCSVLDTPKGWMLMHPGRISHYHEGLHTTKGTRYIAISFVDP